MKKLILVGLGISLLTISNPTHAVAPKVPSPDTTKHVNQSLPPAIIDGIEVPFEVTLYVETEYPGHAVTEAREVSVSGQKGYRLRADRDSYANDYDSIYLFYDTDWDLLDDRQMVAPPRPVVDDTDEDDKKDKDKDDEHEDRREPEEPEEDQEAEPDEPEEPEEPDEPEEPNRRPWRDRDD